MKEVNKNLKNQLLRKMMEEGNIVFEGLDRYPLDGQSSIIVANHSCLMDIFYLAMAIPEEHVSVVSARVLYKNVSPRKEIVTNALQAMPIEPMSGIHSKIAMDAISYLLCEGISASIFPEGTYNDRQSISRGRTGMARILLNTCYKGVYPHYVPIAINVSTDDLDKNRMGINKNDLVQVQILEPVSYEHLVDEYYNTDNYEARNRILHEIVDLGMIRIADSLNIPFSEEYLYVSPKENVMFQDGSEMSFEEALENENVVKYQDEVMTRARRIIGNIRRRK